MSITFWNPEYSVGHDDLDWQHEHIINLVNALEIAESGAGARTADLVLAYLIKVLGRHFSAEEAVMAKAKYPGLELHRNQHEECNLSIAEMLCAIQSGQLHSVDCVPFVREWLHGHMLDADQLYARWLREQNQGHTTACVGTRL